MDYEKTFDWVDWVKMLYILKDLKINWPDKRLICKLYTKQEAVVRDMDKESDP